MRADSELVRFYHRGVLVRVHPRQPPGAGTDPHDLPEHKVGYAPYETLDRLIAACAARAQRRDLRRTDPR